MMYGKEGVRGRKGRVEEGGSEGEGKDTLGSVYHWWDE